MPPGRAPLPSAPPTHQVPAAGKLFPAKNILALGPLHCSPLSLREPGLHAQTDCDSPSGSLSCVTPVDPEALALPLRVVSPERYPGDSLPAQPGEAKPRASCLAVAAPRGAEGL